MAEGSSNKILLLDALYINSGGGLRLLEYLVSELQARGVEFHLLADSRCEGKFDNLPGVTYMKASLGNRYRFYANNKDGFRAFLCFGNIPPQVKVNGPAYTYFHNINLLTLKECPSFKSRVLSWLKRRVFYRYRNNTDYWIVQTSNTRQELARHLRQPLEKILEYPFFELPEGLSDIKNSCHGGDYVFVSYYTGAKGHEELLEAWKILHRRGVDRTLHLTVDNPAFSEEIAKACREGVKIVNHGHVPFSQVMEMYRASAATVYPSHNESLGLGVVEAVSAGCDVIGADLPYIHSICRPSETFEPCSPESIADAVVRYEKDRKKSELLAKNRIDDLINLIIR